MCKIRAKYKHFLNKNTSKNTSKIKVFVLKKRVNSTRDIFTTKVRKSAVFIPYKWYCMVLYCIVLRSWLRRALSITIERKTLNLLPVVSHSNFSQRLRDIYA